jgi:tRNA acetyltransferase TAN1
MGEPNLLVSAGPRAPGRARREIATRLRALGDETPEIGPLLTRGIRAVGTSLDPRRVVAALRTLCLRSPGAFRFTWRWVPVDCWTGTDLEAMRRAVAGLRDRIGPEESWRLTLEKRTPDHLDAGRVIGALAALIDARVDLSHPDKILLVDIFEDRVALAVIGPTEMFSVVKVREETTGRCRAAPS